MKFKIRKAHLPYIIVGTILAISIPVGIGISAILNVPPQNPPYVPDLEVDAEGYVTYVVDGDTFDVNTVGRIRLADIDCPDQGEPGDEGYIVKH